MASISISSITTTSARVTVTADSSASRIWTLYLNGSLYDQTSKLSAQSSYTWTLSGLSPGTTYTVQGRYGPTTGTEYPNTASSTIDSFTTVAKVVYDSDYAYVSYSVTTTSVTITISSITPRSYSRTARFKIDDTIYTKTVSAYSTSTSYTFTGLKSGTSYYFEVALRAPDNTRTFYQELGYISTSSYNYTLTLTVTSTYNRITARVTLNTPQSFDIDATFLLDDARALVADIPAGESFTERYWTTDITPATAYDVSLRDNLKDGEIVHTIRKRTKNNFSWSDWGMNVSQGATFYINPSGWNEYTDQLSSKAAYFGRTYNPATVSAGDTLTAEKYNNIAAVINWLVDNNKGDCETKLNGVNAGDPVTAAIINQLANCLNE